MTSRFRRFVRGLIRRYARVRAWSPLALVLHRPAPPAGMTIVRRLDIQVRATTVVRATTWSAMRPPARTLVTAPAAVATGTSRTRLATANVQRVVARYCVESRRRVETLPPAPRASAVTGLPAPTHGAALSPHDALPPRSLAPPVGVVLRRATGAPPAADGARDGRVAVDVGPVRVPNSAASTAAAAAIDVDHLTTRVIDAIDRRIVAQRERRGRA